MCESDTRQAGVISQDEIEITPEMIEAGACAIDGYDEPFLDYHEKAVLIFRAMLAAHRAGLARDIHAVM